MRRIRVHRLGHIPPLLGPVTPSDRADPLGAEARRNLPDLVPGESRATTGGRMRYGDVKGTIRADAAVGRGPAPAATYRGTEGMMSGSIDRSALPIAPPPGQAASLEPVQPPAGAPNVLIVLLDDVGFGAASTFGGPIPTPNYDSLAAGGLRYNRFHTTAMCSPTRAALLTGRNHHAVANGIVANRRQQRDWRAEARKVLSHIAGHAAVGGADFGGI